jgi:hypothetical protein
LKRKTGSELTFAFLGKFALPRGACPLFQRAASGRGRHRGQSRSENPDCAALPQRLRITPVVKGTGESVGSRDGAKKV